jgi:MFS family permease
MFQLTLAAGQFLMTLDSSVMNVSIATVAKDVGTTVTGIQGAITLYTLVMVMLIVTGSKVGSRPGPFRSPRAHAAGMSPLPKERLAEKLLTSGGLGRAGIVGLLRAVEGVCW